MSPNDRQLAPVQSNPQDALAPSSSDGVVGGIGLLTDPYGAARRALRGRLRLAVVLGVVTGLVGGIVGWMSAAPEYRSEGLVQIAYSVPPVLRSDGDGSYLPVEIFQAYLGAQQVALGSERVVRRALNTPAWEQTGRGDSALVLEDFAQNLKVEHRAGTDYLRVSYTDRNPRIASAAVRAVITAYEQQYQQRDDELARQRIAALDQQRQGLLGQLDDLQSQLRSSSRDVGVGNADRLYEAAVADVTKLQGALTDIRIQMALVRRQADRAGSGGGGNIRNVQQIAALDPTMMRYLSERERLETLIAQYRSNGYGENHPRLVEAKKLLEAQVQRIDEYLQTVRIAGPAGAGAAAPVPGAAAGGLAAGLIGRSPEALTMDEQAIGKLYDQALERMTALGGKRNRLETIKAQIDGLNKELADVGRRMQTLQLESGVRGKLNVISLGDTSLQPYRDPRMQSATMGVVGGALLPAALLVLLGLANRRYRFSEETEEDLSNQTRLLGILPMLDDGMDDPDQVAQASQCVHQIRVMLQSSMAAESGANGHAASKRQRQPQQMYFISSASPGEGKTSLTAALGLSFAASGSKTLLIDADMLGQRLTHNFSVEQLPGLHEALLSGTLLGQVTKTGKKDLWIVPAGQADAQDVGIMSGVSMQRLLEEARRHFDVVLIDSGPVLGSIEATVLAPLSDGVVLVIARHQQRPLVEKAIRQLGAIRAPLAGIVFNRAEARDFAASRFNSSARSTGWHPGDGGVAVRQRYGEETARYEPLARSVASFLPAKDAGDASGTGSQDETEHTEGGGGGGRNGNGHGRR